MSIVRKFAVGMAAAGMALSLTAAAEAAPGPKPVLHELRESRAEVLRFWTDARMESAKPAKLRGAGDDAQGAQRRAPEGDGTPTEALDAPAALPRSVDRSRAPRAPKALRTTARASWAGQELPWSNWSYGYTSAAKPVGRLFYVMPNGRSNYCSASVVAPNVVMTAAHCVQNGSTGAFNTSFQFVPAVYGTSRPYGGFAGRHVSVYSNWATGGGYYPMDYAFVTLNRNAAGYNVGQYTGSYGLWPNAPKANAYLLGYPAEGSWATYQNYPYHCKSPIQRYNAYAGGRYDVGLSCYNTGGSSGGPWFITASDGRAYIASVMSHMGVVKWQSSTCTWNGCPRFGTTFFGPYINGETTQLLNIAKTK